MSENDVRSIKEHRGIARTTQLLFASFAMIQLLEAIKYSLLLHENRPITSLPIIRRVVALGGDDLLPLQVLLFLILTILTIIWLYNAYRNMEDKYHISPYYKPYWTILGFFIPIVNLYMPIVIVSELYCASKNYARILKDQNSQHNEQNTPAIVVFWWLSLLLAAAPSFVLIRMLHINTRPARLVEGIAQSLMLFASAVLMARIIRKVSLKNE
jgi:hypothetical protein